MSHICTWCGTAYEPRTNGGKRQKFCSKDCRQDFFATCRDWAVSEVEAGRVLVSTVRRGTEQRARSLGRDLGQEATRGAPRASGTLRGL